MTKTNKKKFFLASVASIALVAFPLAWAENVPKASYLHYLKYLLYQRTDEPSKALAELILAYQANPKAEELAEEIVETALDMQQIQIAKVYMQVAQQRHPNDTQTKLLEAKVMMSQGLLDDALIALKQALAREPKNPEVLLDLAAIYAELNDKTSAMRYLDSYLKISPSTPDLLKIKAAYQIEDNDPKVIDTLKEAFEQDPEDPEVLEGLIGAYQKYKNVSDLESFLSQASRDNPLNNQLRLKLCAVSESGVARKNCLQEALDAEPANTQILGYLLEQFEREEAWEEALETLRSHSQTAQADAVFALKESFYLLHLDNLKEAVAILETKRGRFPDNDDIAYFLALGYQDMNELDKSKTVLASLYAKRPDWREMAYTYALVAGETGDNATMETVLGDLHRRFPDDPAIANALGFTWAEQGKNLTQAKRLIERALTTDPKNYFFQDSMAWALFKAGQIKEAELLLRKAAEATQDPEILLHLAQLEQHEGQDRRAWSDYLSAKFKLAHAKKSSVRLALEIKRLERSLSHRARPAAREVLGERSALAQAGFSGVFRCEWRLTGQSPFRSRVSLAISPEERMSVLYWPPGALKPLTAQEIAISMEESRPILEEFEAALKGFFQHRSWNPDATLSSGPDAMDSSIARLKWKIKNNFSVRATSRHLKTEFSNFYTDGKLPTATTQFGGLVPRTIRLNGRRLNATCEALDYAKE